MRRYPATTHAVAAVHPVVRAVVLTLLAMVLVALAPVPAAHAETGTRVVAVEEISEDVGPAVRGPNDEDNEFAPREFEANYLHGANYGLLVGLVLLFALLGLLYWLKVGRYSRAERS